MLGDSINTNNFNCNLVVLKKKLVQFLKIAIFGPNLGKKGGSLGAALKTKNNFLQQSQNHMISFQKRLTLSK